MYFFDLTQHRWNDRILKLNTNKKLSKGDLVQYNNHFLIFLWNKVKFDTLYDYTKQAKSSEIKIYEKNFFSEKTIEWISWMVEQYFTTYKNVFKLFLPTFEIEKILKYKKNKKKQSGIQNLVIFPDLWTAYNQTQSLNIFSGQNTTISKLKLFWQIKSWETIDLICTHSAIFQDWQNLKQITIYYPHRWYYKNQQDPRYNTYEVVKFMTKIYNSKLKIINSLIL